MPITLLSAGAAPFPAPLAGRIASGAVGTMPVLTREEAQTSAPWPVRRVPIVLLSAGAAPFPAPLAGRIASGTMGTMPVLTREEAQT